MVTLAIIPKGNLSTSTCAEGVYITWYIPPSIYHSNSRVWSRASIVPFKEESEKLQGNKTVPQTSMLGSGRTRIQTQAYWKWSSILLATCQVRVKLNCPHMICVQKLSKCSSPLHYLQGKSVRTKNVWDPAQMNVVHSFSKRTRLACTQSFHFKYDSSSLRVMMEGLAITMLED